MSRDNYPIEGSNEEVKFFQFICALKQIKKHKGALFKAKRIKQSSDTAGKSNVMYQIEPRVPEVAKIFWWHPCKLLTDNTLIYHPYLRLWETRKSHVLNSSSEAMASLQAVLTKPFSADSCQQVLADLNADYYWIKEQLNFAPFAEQVRNYEAAFIQQLAETKEYFRDFFQVDSIFALYKTTLIFKFDAINQTQRLATISIYRAKLLSNLKNNELIGADCRYVWKVFSNAIDFKLRLQLFIARKMPELSYGDTKQDNRCKAIEAIAKEVAEKIDVTLQDEVLSETELLIPLSYCSSMPKKSMRQAKEDYFKAIDRYFLQAMWHPLYRVACQSPKKMLFGKGND